MQGSIKSMLVTNFEQENFWPLLSQKYFKVSELHVALRYFCSLTYVHSSSIEGFCSVLS